MNPMPASMDRMNRAATVRSARLAAAGSSESAGSSRGAGGGLSCAAVPSRVRCSAGGGVPITRCGARDGSVSSPWPAGAAG